MMKKIIGILALLMAFQLNAQEKQPVYSIVKVVQEISWYETQAELWKKDIDLDNTNGEAWYNYYMANRGLKNMSESPEDKKKYKEKCAEIAKACYKAIPNSFEGNYLVYYDSGISDSETKYEYLLKSQKISPDDPRIFSDLLVYYQVNLDSENATLMAKKMFERNELSSDLLNWGYNVLAELDEDAIVFTAGDNDTYALWLAQDALGFRKDVTVINAHLVQIDDYRKLLTDKLGLEEISGEDNKQLYDHFLANSKSIPAYISMSAMGFFRQPDNANESIDENLYLNGLTYKYSKEDFDNSGVIRRNYEKRYLIDYLQVDFNYDELYQNTSGHINGTYLASMIKLYKIYKTGEENDKAAELIKLINKIAKNTGYEGYVKKLLEDC